MGSLFGVKFALFLCHVAHLASLGQSIECAGSAVYRLTFVAEWSKITHPKDFPSDPHFSPVVGCSHNSSYVMWRPGSLASPGVKEVAETGRTSIMEKEIKAQIKSKYAYHLIKGSSFNSPGTVTVDGITVNSDYSLVSAISMIAPSPDWIVGIRDYGLCNQTTGKWLDKRVRNLFPYDAGTDSGLNFQSDDNPTSPPEDIILMHNTIPGSFQGDEPIRSLGTFTLEKISETTPKPNVDTTTASPTETSMAYEMSTSIPKEMSQSSSQFYMTATTASLKETSMAYEMSTSMPKEMSQSSSQLYTTATQSKPMATVGLNATGGGTPPPTTTQSVMTSSIGPSDIPTVTTTSGACPGLNSSVLLKFTISFLFLMCNI